ncbi:MAG: hypothetical protein HKN47_16750 [Pirellulaceae bacterium]|nr:hypothetical protein [Pirellulaceae bacterium]
MRSRVPSQVFKTLQVALRIASCGVVVFLGFLVLRNLSILFNDSALVTEPDHVTSDAVSNGVPLGAGQSFHADGYWTFAGWTWELQRSTGTEQDVDIPEAFHLQPPTTTPVEAELIGLLRDLGATREARDSYDVYHLQLGQAELKIAAVVDAPQPWIAEAVMGVPTTNTVSSSTSWSLFRLRRSSLIAAGHQRPQLLPFPSYTKLVGARFDERGNPQAEFLHQCPAIPVWIKQLSDAGYTTSTAPRLAEFQRSWIVTKQRESFVVWEPSRKAVGMLLISRLTSDGPSPDKHPTQPREAMR